ncbi:MAG: endonuclease MutS2 [Anaerolineae bacterium]|nr:endonuclease MutS2 [Anaerolineae bacterium]
MTKAQERVTAEMDPKSLQTLELPKILERLADYAAFSASAERVRDLAPTTNLAEAVNRQQETAEAVELLTQKPDISVGGARDVRADAGRAARGITLDPQVLLNVRTTLQHGARLQRTLTQLRGQFPILAETASFIEPCADVVDAIGRTLNERGEVLDSASPKLARIRGEIRVAFDRLMSKLNAMVNNPNNTRWLQEPIITQRSGRYVIPLRSEFKGRIQGVVHDQSASGATLFIEPLATVDLNNTYRQLQLDEEEEVHRILAELSQQVGDRARAITRTVDALASLDLAFAKAKYALDTDAHKPELVAFREVSGAGTRAHPGSTLRLVEARHPLLDRDIVVPIDVAFEGDTYVLVVTGPNTGGKTVALKTVGLLVLMAQCGLHLPAKEAALSVFQGVYADIGDEQSIEQSLSTFSSHMRNIIGILDKADERSLVLLDELGAGTDPAEGSALARALLSALLDKGLTTMVTTHHPELKVFAQQTAGVRNASVEFDLETLAPTYRLIVGLPGRSNALAIAARLGLPEDIIEEARGLVSESDLAVDDLLDEIRRSRDEAAQALASAAQARAQTEAARDELRARLDAIEDERREVLRRARNKGKRDVQRLRTQVRKLRDQMRAAALPLDALRQVEARAEQLEARMETPVAPATEMPLEDEAEIPALRLGETVWVRPLQAEGQITELTAGEAEVQVGRLRLRARLEDLQRRGRLDRKLAEAEKRHDPLPTRAPSPGMELDIRGQLVEDALPRLEAYLDAAYMAGLPFVRIIHGKGTGALRHAVRESLRGHPLVRSSQRGAENEGGDGVTVVKIVEQS